MVLTCGNHYLAELIKAQNKIKYIRLIDASNKYNKHDRRFEDIFQALEKQAYSILYLNLDYIDSSFLLSKFVNLETLILSKNCDFKNLGTAIYSNLQILELIHSKTLNIATYIIQNTNGNLWKVKIDAIEINIRDKNFDGENFLNLLIRFAPISLYKVTINFDDFTIESLNLFFSNWKNRKTLHIYNEYWSYNYEDYNFEEVVLKRYNDFWDDDYKKRATIQD
ncbi:hypothetical protein C1645_817860 [Glomus cerebriforme]|uniref:F-box associated domain-containing protein n=1 Tax=Glomus cerebriforme TaxID=658196 RepID=A0A397TE21_9GLOM|nr:hypothetical protein C1645_817860 [Glomus cerebriforme]